MNFTINTGFNSNSVEQNWRKSNLDKNILLIATSDIIPPQNTEILSIVSITMLQILRYYIKYTISKSVMLKGNQKAIRLLCLAFRNIEILIFIKHFNRFNF